MKTNQRVWHGGLAEQAEELCLTFAQGALGALKAANIENQRVGERPHQGDGQTGQCDSLDCALLPARQHTVVVPCVERGNRKPGQFAVGVELHTEVIVEKALVVERAFHGIGTQYGKLLLS